MQWYSWMTLITVAGGIMASLVIFPKALSIVATIVDAVAPALKAAVDGVVWVAKNVIGPGIKDILDDWVTIVTVGAFAFMLWGWMDLKVDRAVDQLGTCQTEITKLRKAAKGMEQRHQNNFWWPIW